MFKIAKTWKQPKYPWTDKEDVVHIYTMEYYLAIKKSEIMPFAVYMDGPRNYHTK